MYSAVSANPQRSRRVVSFLAIGSLAFIVYEAVRSSLSSVKDASADPTDNHKNNSTLASSTDFFQGIRVSSENIPANAYTFNKQLIESLRIWKAAQKRSCWIKLPIELASTHLSYILKQGFIIHHSRPSYLMCNQWLALDGESNMIPDYCSTYTAVGCLILNSRREVVVIQEKWKRKAQEWWKFPGGAVDRCEHISAAAERETKEETGLDVTFISILTFRHYYPGRFRNTSDIYFVCLMRVNDDEQPFNMDPKEIGECKWMELDEMLKLESQSVTLGNQSTIQYIRSQCELLLNDDQNNNNNSNTIEKSKANSNTDNEEKENESGRGGLLVHQSSLAANKISGGRVRDREWMVYSPRVK